jgi:hypothetical protein
VAGAATLALTAGQVVDEDDALAAVALGNDLVSEHGSRRRSPDLLDVRPAEPAGQHTYELALTLRLRHVVQPRLPVAVEHDRAH